MPDEELLGFINELEQPARTYLYGRRMYEAMLYWETAHTTVQPRLFQEFTGIWQAAEKIVFSKTLASVSSARTRVEPAFEPGLVRQLKSAAEHDMRVGGADLAGQAIKAGPADEVRLFLVPVVVGGGKRALPDGVRSDLEVLDTQRFASGAVYLRYSLSDGADLGDPGLEHPARAGRRDVPTGLARGSGLGNSHRSSAGARAAGPVRQEADPGLSQGAGVCLRPSQAVRTIPVAR
jgi:dihydrofolate reductase